MNEESLKAKIIELLDNKEEAELLLVYEILTRL